jgi:chemotaxis protein MotB
MVTFSDCMTLLLTFFVLLLTFSSFDDKAFLKMTTSLGNAMPSMAMRRKTENAVSQSQPVIYQPNRQRGSEKPDADGDREGNIEDGQLHLDFEQRRVYLVPSSRIFLGLGAELSQEGKDLLADFAFVAQDMAHPVVISEHPQPAPRGGDRLGMRRTWSVVRYLTDREGLDRRRFAISASPTVPAENIPPGNDIRGEDRLLAITLLDRSVNQ